MINIQKPSPVSHEGKFLEVHSIFRTIQGEGPFSGRSAIFIRLSGCNLQCPFCDTDYTNGSVVKSVKEIRSELFEIFGVTPIEETELYPEQPLLNRLIVITGGEPFRQNISALIYMLLQEGAVIQIETNGTLRGKDIPFHSPNLHIVCSPKTKTIDAGIKMNVKAFKYVINHNSIDWENGLPALALGNQNSARHVAMPTRGIPVYVQPADMQNETENKLNLEACIELVHRFGYTLCLQTHKIINLP